MKLERLPLIFADNQSIDMAFPYIRVPSKYLCARSSQPQHSRAPHLLAQLAFAGSSGRRVRCSFT